MSEDRRADSFGGAFWDEKFADADYVYGRGPNLFLAEQAHRLPKAARLFLPGDGEGRNSVWLAEQGHQVRSVDLSSEGPKKARALAADRGVAIQAETGDLLDWDWPQETFDGIAAFYLHLPPDARQVIHRRMLDALRSGGLILLEAFTPDQLAYKRRYGSGGPGDADLLYRAETLRADFAEAEPLLLEERIVELDEGALHKGPAAVVRAVFRKPEAG